MRGWNVWFANGSMMPARPTAMIHGSAQCVRTSVTTQRLTRPHRQHQVAQPHADERRQIASRDLRRRVDRAILLRQLRQLGPGDERVAPRLDRFARLEPSASSYAAIAPC